MKHKKLVLFDIDGTLIRHTTSHVIGGWPRFIYAAKKAYGVDAKPNPDKNYNGWVDRQIFYDIVAQHGVTKEQFQRKFPKASAALREFAEKQSKKGKYYEAIPEAIRLAKTLSLNSNFYIGLLTGNVRSMAEWKLAHAGIDAQLFRFGLFSDEADDRIALVKQLFMKAKIEIPFDFLPDQVVIIGDSLGDIRCARVIKAKVIIVATGGHLKEELRKEHPDLLVDSLMDERVLALLGLN